jgi:hypothetical protein
MARIEARNGTVVLRTNNFTHVASYLDLIMIPIVTTRACKVTFYW